MSIINVLKKEEKKLERKLAQISHGIHKELESVRRAIKAYSSRSISSGKVIKTRRKMSAATKRKIQLAAKKRWALERKAGAKA